MKQKDAEHIEKLVKIGIALSATKELEVFFKMVLQEAISYTNADAGSLYMVSDDGRYLDFKIICTVSKGLSLGMADTEKWPSVPLYLENNSPSLHNFVAYVFHNKSAMDIADVYNQDIFDNSGTRKYDGANNYHSKSMVAVPLLNHEDDIVGVIQLINAQDDGGNIIAFNPLHISMVQALASLAAIAYTNNMLISGLEKLLFQFIQSIASAIDHKSRYTGGHIQRVALLAEKIADLVNRDQDKFKDIFFNENELKEISIAGWMHDIGKITTPVHIMDKSHKLETIYDRIDLVEARVNSLISIIKCHLGKDEDSNKKQLILLKKKLVEDLDFLKQLNEGSEYLSSDKEERLRQIAKNPVKIGGVIFPLITEDELKNLAIKKGTLLPEEMAIMRDHVTMTQEMLSGLTFPKKYRNVPLYAASHHEKLNGKGYPLGLKGEELPVQSRILAVADLFESLTAADRPYKKGMPLSKALRIMCYMTKDGEIDEDLLTLLLDSKLVRNYAKEYLHDYQIDEYNISELKEIYGNNQ